VATDTVKEQVAEAAIAVASGAKALGYTGAGTAVVFGLNQGEWSIVGIIGGLAIGALGLFINAGITYYFKRQHLRLAAQGRTLAGDA
jgi:hypothetical protein